MQPGQGQPPIDIRNAVDVICEQCENDTFDQVSYMKKISAMLSPTGQRAYIPIPVYACASCGHINEEFRPENLGD